MLEPALFFLISFLLVMLVVYLWTSQRNLIKNRALTPKEYLWKLKQISDKSEYELFHYRTATSRALIVASVIYFKYRLFKTSVRVYSKYQ